MVTVRTAIWINAPLERCFNLATNLDFLLEADKSKKLRVIAGPNERQMKQGDSLTWKGSGLGKSLTSRVEVLRPFNYFREVISGSLFDDFEHEHHFVVMDDGTRIRNEVRFTVRLGVLGNLLGKLVLRRRIVKKLQWRNRILKETAESDGWRKFLEGQTGAQKMAASPKPNDEPGLKGETKSQFFAH